MKIDMHLHTNRYSSCAVMTPEEMAVSALNYGLDGVVITEHDYLWTVDEIAELQNKFPTLKIFRGAEISTKQGHVLVYGLSSIEELYKDISILDLVKYVHENNGIAIIAHPCRYKDEIPDEIFEALIDGIEIMSSNILGYMKEPIKFIKSKLNIPGIVGSDGHKTDSVGIYATDFTNSINSEQDLIKAVKADSFNIYKDIDRISLNNNNLNEKVIKTKKLIDDGLDKATIKQLVGANFSFQYGVENNKDMRSISEDYI